MEAEMTRNKKRSKVEVEGLVCYADDDPLAEVAIVTDYGQELLVDPAGPMSTLHHWMDSVVHVVGRFVRRDGRRYLQVERIHRVQGEHEYDDLYDGDDRWDSGELGWDDGGSEYEDQF
jgi:hypothetical protein